MFLELKAFIRFAHIGKYAYVSMCEYWVIYEGSDHSLMTLKLSHSAYIENLL